MEPLFSPLTIIGFGSQAKAWALNLKDSKINVKIALNANSKSKKIAQDLGFETVELKTNELKELKTLILLIPDDQQKKFIEENKAFIHPKAHLIYAHGFSVSKFKLDEIYNQFTHSLLAPKAIASEVRFQYETKGKIGAAFFAKNDEIKKELDYIAKSVGFTALYKSSFDEETKADLFSEQSLLCSILPYVSLKSFNILRKNGISKEVAFMECFLELQSISKALVTLGPEAFFKLISPNALIGAHKGKTTLLDANFDKNLESLFSAINDKSFYKEVEIDANALREEILKEWDKEELTQVFKELKADLINK